MVVFFSRLFDPNPDFKRAAPNMVDGGCKSEVSVDIDRLAYNDGIDGCCYHPCHRMMLVYIGKSGLFGHLVQDF